MDSTNLEEYADPVAYDDENGLDEEGPFFLELARRYGGPILDVACGTGRLTIPLARAGYSCVGIDISPAMISRAESKSAGLPVRYELGDCREFTTDVRFGFALMTGHGFQGCLTDSDQRCTLEMVFRHLRRRGAFAFETRNPIAADLEKGRSWERSYQSRAGAWIDAYCTTVYDPVGDLLQVTHHRIERQSGAERISRISLRYTSDAHCRALIESAGFRIVGAYGDWDCRPIDDSCKELIYVCEHP